MKKVTQATQIFHYFILLLLMIIATILFYRLTGFPQQQLQLTFFTAVTYFFWGIFHHLSHQDLNWKIVVEYGSIALIGFTFIWAYISLIS